MKTRLDGLVYYLLVFVCVCCTSCIQSSTCAAHTFHEHFNLMSTADGSVCETEPLDCWYIDGSNTSTCSRLLPFVAVKAQQCIDNDRTTNQHTALNHTTTDDDDVQAEAAAAADSIAPFDEWTEQQLHKKLALSGSQPAPTTPVVSEQSTVPQTTGSTSKGNAPGQSVPPVSPTEPVIALPFIPVLSHSSQRNYAAKECGAKVLQSHAEAENRASILKEREPDEYMRTVCRTEHGQFLVVELCDTIQPHSIDIANFELFSSSPALIVVHASERYPTNDWQALANITAADTRHVQSFPLTTHTFAKFIKLEMLEYYGHEHYCTLSLLRVFGVSIGDQMELEAEQHIYAPATTPVAANTPDKSASDLSGEASSSDQSSSESVPSTNHVESIPDSAESDSQSAPNKSEPGGLIGRVRDVVLQTVSKAASLIQTPATNNHTTHTPAFSLRVHLSRCGMCPRPDMQPTCSAFCYLFPQPISKEQTTVNREHKPAISAPVPVPSVQPNVPKAVPSIPKPVTTVNSKRSSQALFLALLLRVMREAERPLQPVNVVVPAPPQGPKGGRPVQRVDRSPNTGNGEQKDTSQSAPSGSLPGSAHSPKESVFLRLNSRIRALELNISLSSQYLSELSRKYRNHTESLYRQYNRTVQRLNETNVRLAEQGQAHALQTQALLLHIQTLNTTVHSLYNQSTDCYDIQQIQNFVISACLLQAVVVLVLVRLCCMSTKTVVVQHNIQPATLTTTNNKVQVSDESVPQVSKDGMKEETAESEAENEPINDGGCSKLIGCPESSRTKAETSQYKSVSLVDITQKDAPNNNKNSEQSLPTTSIPMQQLNRNKKSKSKKKHSFS